MRLSREAIQRMVGDRVGGGGGAGGGGGISMDDIQGMGFATEQWANDNYVAIPYFTQLFTIHGKQTTTVDGEVTDEQDITLPPNTMPSRTETTEGGVTTVVETTITRIEALFDFNSVGGVSSLGYNPGGGGGGDTLTEPLASINNASLGMPTAAGQVITWNGTQWIFDIPEGGGGGGTGTVTSITAGTGLSGGTITTMGTIAISSTYQGYITHGETAYGWGNHANAGYLTQSSLSGYATQSWVANQGYATQTWVTGRGYITSAALSGYATQAWVNNQGYATQTWVTGRGYITSAALSGYATQTWVNSQGFLTQDSLSLYLPLSGGTMTGQIQRSSNGWWILGRDNAVIRQNGGSSAGWSPVFSLKTQNGSWEMGGITQTDAVDKLILAYNTDYNYNNNINSSTYRIDFPQASGTLATQEWVSSHGYMLRTEGMRFTNYGNYIAAQFVNADGTNDSTRAANARGSGYIEWWSDSYFNHRMGSVSIYDGVNNDTCYLQIGGGRIYWDPSSKSLYVVQSDGSTPANFYATGGVSALGISTGGTPSVSALTVGTLTASSQLNVGGTSSFTGAMTANAMTVNGNISATNWQIPTTGYARFARLYLDSTRYVYVSSGHLYFYNGSSSVQIV